MHGSWARYAIAEAMALVQSSGRSPTKAGWPAASPGLGLYRPFPAAWFDSKEAPVIVYNKLVRDRIPAIIASEGRQAEVRVLDEAAYLTALRATLVEEAEEHRAAGDAAELVDVLEVVYALAAASGISPEQLERDRRRKREERGGFEERLLLVSVADQPLQAPRAAARSFRLAEPSDSTIRLWHRWARSSWGARSDR
jgi:predicted house-cleaning noncanonical NTP pyrophosphatase (MazG superfamily)